MTDKEPLLFPSFKNLNERIAEKKQEFNNIKESIEKSQKKLDKLNKQIEKLTKQKSKLYKRNEDLRKDLFYLQLQVDNYPNNEEYLEESIEKSKKQLAYLEHYIKQKQILIKTDKEAQMLIEEKLKPLMECNVLLQDIIIWLKQQKAIKLDNVDILKKLKGTSRVPQGYLSPDVKEIMEDFGCYDYNYPTEEMLKNFYNTLEKLEKEYYD